MSRHASASQRRNSCYGCLVNSSWTCGARCRGFGFARPIERRTKNTIIWASSRTVGTTAMSTAT